MKCPHCQKDVNDKTSPEALLAHIKMHVAKQSRSIAEVEKRLGKGRSVPDHWHATLKKWQAWADWVEDRIEESKGAKT